MTETVHQKFTEIVPITFTRNRLKVRLKACIRQFVDLSESNRRGPVAQLALDNSISNCRTLDIIAVMQHLKIRQTFLTPEWYWPAALAVKNTLRPRLKVTIP